ncbi:ATP-binding cassette domain-containing protein [Promicromonospora thailandica]|uniref:ABC-2 type transport system ATP-binding protein n=1 Tax=Promicromonospora thailandica TaxID=765201 RepID=A0A9X2G8U4_9MICO|nr:ATP-binding cassette domain-containing protein [Promicromonospora thailandica]MCP2265284.1 ABC-2 type transport system ATP-binding protein [Promicromonospora thailandica]BFF19626.1 daunorubicin resistance protein DrrA family ABC transporter ATP-binding protein [Promicromonospora thailandica]
MTAIVTAEGLRKSFARRDPASPPVLDGLDLELEEGAVLALLGPNGAGKTTTVRILTTLLRPDAGRATVAGHDVVRDASRVRELISLTGQQVAVDDKLSGAENLTMMGHLAHLPRRAVRDRVDALLTAFDLADAAGRRVATWSGGMRRRLDLAAGLLTRPRVMFLDEPTTGLDPRSRQALWDVVRGVVADGTSVFLTTQYLEEADRLARRVALVDGGRVVAEGTPAQLKREVGEAGVELVLASPADAALVAPALAVPTPEGARVRVPTDGSVAHVRAVLSAVEATGVVPEHWEVRAPTLDDVFLALTGHAGQERAARPAGVAA